MAITTGNLAGLEWTEDAASDAESVLIPNQILPPQKPIIENINIKEYPVYEPKYAQPYNPHLGFYLNRKQTQFAPDWSEQPNNRAYNMRDVSGEVGEYGQIPGQGYNEDMHTQKKGSNLLDYLPGRVILKGIASMLPKMDPRQVALRDFYGYDDIGRVPPGELMAGYNPVSGGLFGGETNYGLQAAYDKRMARIEKTLGSKYNLSDAQIQDIYAGTLKDEDEYDTQLIQRLRDLKAAKAAEAEMLNKINQTTQGGTTTTTTTPSGGSGAADAATSGRGFEHTRGQTSQQRGAAASRMGGGSRQAKSGSQVAGGSGRTDSGWGWKEGGRIGYNRGRVVNPGGYQGDEEFEDENIFEFMQDQGIPHSEMVEGMSPFEMRIQELVDEGMSWQEAYQIASEEFGQIAEGPEESFSEEGIASIV